MIDATLTTPDFSTRPDLEVKTLQLFHIAQSTRDWSQGEILVGHVFSAMHSSALPVARITRIAEALHGFEPGALDLTKALTDLTRAKVLRSRMIQGVRHYEVNY